MKITKTNIQDVQYITCDHNWVIIAGFIPDSVRRVCKAERNVIKCSGDSDVLVPSAKMLCKEDTDDPPLARLNDCRRDENVFGVGGTVGPCPGAGDDGLDVEGVGDVGRGDFRDAEATTLGAGFFLLEKGERKRDHSDSN